SARLWGENPAGDGVSAGEGARGIAAGLERRHDGVMGAQGRKLFVPSHLVVDDHERKPGFQEGSIQVDGPAEARAGRVQDAHAVERSSLADGDGIPWVEGDEYVTRRSGNAGEQRLSGGAILRCRAEWTRIVEVHAEVNDERGRYQIPAQLAGAGKHRECDQG